MGEVRASVIIVSFNSRVDLARLIPSLLRSISPAEEVIIVDNASTDGSPEWVSSEYPQIHLIRSVDNLGFGISIPSYKWAPAPGKG